MPRSGGASRTTATLIPQSSITHGGRGGLSTQHTNKPRTNRAPAWLQVRRGLTQSPQTQQSELGGAWAPLTCPHSDTRRARKCKRWEGVGEELLVGLLERRLPTAALAVGTMSIACIQQQRTPRISTAGVDVGRSAFPRLSACREAHKRAAGFFFYFFLSELLALSLSLCRRRDTLMKTTGNLWSQWGIVLSYILYPHPVHHTDKQIHHFLWMTAWHKAATSLDLSEHEPWQARLQKHLLYEATIHRKRASSACGRDMHMVKLLNLHRSPQFSNI